MSRKLLLTAKLKKKKVNSLIICQTINDNTSRRLQSDNILEEAVCKLILMEKPLLSSQNFNQNMVKILPIHKTN